MALDLGFATILIRQRYGNRFTETLGFKITIIFSTCGHTLINFYLKRRLGALTLATICTFALGLVSSLTYSLIGPVFNLLGQANDTRTIALHELLGSQIGAWLSQLLGRTSLMSSELWAILPALLVSAALVRALLALLQWYLWEKSSEQIARDLRADLVKMYMQLDPEKRRSLNLEIDQEIGSAISTDVRMVREYLVHVYGGFPRECVQVLFYLASLLLLDWKLALIFLLGLGPAAAILAKLGKKLRKRSQAALGNSSTMLEWLQQRLTGIETIKQFQTEYLEQNRMEKKSHELLKDFLRAARVKARTSPLLEVVAVAAMMLVLVYALNSIANREMSSSTLLSFLVLLGVLSQSASKLGRYFNSNKEGEAARDRLQALMTTMQSVVAEDIPLHCVPAAPYSLAVRNLSYAYDNHAPRALVDFSAEFERGRIYAIAGPSGSGKSTLAKLLLGLWHPQAGSIEFGIRSRDELGYLPQNVQLLPGPLYSNVIYPLSEYQTECLRNALQRVGMLEYVEALPHSWNSIVGDGGDIVLSGGQAQRLHMARLIYFAFPLLIIDEGTSALDPEIEKLVLQTLKDLANGGSTVIMIAHRVSVLQLADQIYVLRQGLTQFVGQAKEFLQRPDWRSYFESVES